MIAGVVSLAACGGGDESSKKAGDTTTTTETPAAEEKKPEAAPASDAVTLEITANDIMQYDKKELKVKAGQKVTLTLHHAGKLAKENMGHNIVIVLLVLYVKQIFHPQNHRHKY